mmetsp:Transcript_8330/g.17997  ORF Transcript_8330/g.17997 Transcript_8330/m.17997 type:complete len:340 (-) Transcript_8330:80-1099(-)
MMSRACSRSSLLLLVLLLIVPSESLGLSVPRASSVSRRLRSSVTTNNRSTRSSTTTENGTLLNANMRGGGGSEGNGVASPLPSLSKLSRSISRGYRARVAADPNFLVKSVLEVALAAGTQFAAEWNRRGGVKGCLTEIDFVVAGVLTAIAGKYYSAWRVAPTAKIDGDDDNDDAGDGSKDGVLVEEDGFWSTKVPSNAFQPYLLDGATRPTPIGRLASLVAPIPTLFRAGVIASAIGYGLTSVLITLRTLLVPDYVAQTVNINIVHACVYTGAFMSIVSNIRYQLLQGLIEPKLVDRFFGRWPPVQAALTFAVRLANGLLGSMIAIAGMKWLGLQKLKS